MEENLDFLGREDSTPIVPQVDAMDTPDFGYAGEIINNIVPNDVTNFGIDDVKYYSGNSVSNTLNQQDTAQKLFEQAVFSGGEANPELSGYSNPTDYNRNQVNYDRYYNHPKFKDLGFSPFRDNESLYNQNGTWGDEYSRMFGQFGKLFATGFTSTFESMGDLISGEPAKLFDESAGAYSKAAEIGMTSKGGVLGFTNNLLLNSGYTLGILSEIAIEELALGALTVGSGGLGAGVAAARTGQNLGKLSRIGEMFSATRNFVKGLDRAGDAKRFWKSAGQFLNPFENTIDAYRSIKKLNTGKNAVYRLDNMAKATKYFGAFYRDIRNANAALAESKLEGGMVRDEVYKSLMNDYKNNNNFTLPEGQDHQAILDQAQKAGFETEMKNMPLIYFSNKLAFDNILRGYRPLQRVVNESSGIVGDALRKTTIKGVPKYVRKKFTDIFTTPFTDPKAALRNVLGKGARYSMTNVTEGFQELAQETISDSYKNFYIKTFQDPSLLHKNYMSTSLKDAIDRQVFSSQGIETFLSGFLMGGVAGPFGKFMYQTLPAAGKYLTDREGYKQYKQEKEEIIRSTQEKLNEALENPFSVFNTTDENFVLQKEAQKIMEDAAAKGDQLSFQDAKDEALFGLVAKDLEKSQQLQFLAQTGELDVLRDHVEKIAELDDAEFKEAYGLAAEEKSKKVQETLDRIDSLKNANEQIEERFGDNPFRPDLYSVNSAAYRSEMAQYKAWEGAKLNLLYQMYAKNRAAERKASLLEEATGVPLFDGMAASDFNIMFDNLSLEKELETLELEIENAGEVTDPALQKQLEFKKKKVALLKKYKETYDDNLKKDGTYDMRKVNRVYKVFRDYIDLVKDNTSPKSIISDPAVRSVFAQAFDYKVLDKRQQLLEESINILMDPVYFKQLGDRVAKVSAEAFEQIKESLQEKLAGHIDLLEKNDVIASLKELGVLVDPDQAIEYLKTGKVPTIFYHESVIGPVTKEDPIYATIAQLFAIKQAKDAAEAREKTESSGDSKQQGQDKSDMVQDEKDPVVEEDVSPFMMAVINRQYENYLKALPEVEAPESKEEFVQRAKIKSIIKAISELEKTYNEIQDDKPEFEEWLVDHKLSTKVQNILVANNVSFNDIFLREEDPNNFNKNTLDESEVLESAAYKGVFVVSILTEDGTKVYTITDSNKEMYDNISTDNEESNAKLGSFYYADIKAAEEAQKIVGDYLEASQQGFTFDGVTFKTGDTIHDNNNEYQVVSKPQEIEKDPNTLRVRNTKTGNVINLKSFSGYTKGPRPGLDTSNFTSKLRSLNSVNKAWGRRLENETQEEANDRLDTLLTNVSLQDLMNSFSIRISKTGNSAQRYSYLKLDDQKENKQFGFFRDPYAIELVLNGTTIGYLPNPTSSAFLDSQGNPIPVDKISVDLFKKAFYTKGSYAKMLGDFKAGYKNRLALLNYLKEQLGDNESVEISYKDLSKVARVNTNTGSYDFLPFDAEKLSFSELRFNTVDGGIYVIDRQKNYKDGVQTDVEAAPITDLDSETREALEKEIKEVRFDKNNRDVLANYGRYVAVVRLGNGKLRFVELTSANITEEAQEQFAADLKGRIDQTKQENVKEGEVVAQEYNDAWNKKNINDALFLALPVSQKGKFINFAITPKGNIVIEFINKKSGKADPIKRTTLIENPEFNSFTELVSILNKAIERHDANPKVRETNKMGVSLTKDSFKQTLPKSVTTEDVLTLKTSVGPNVVKDISLTINMAELPSDVEVDPVNAPAEPDVLDKTDAVNMSSAPQGANAITPDLLRGTAPSNDKKEVKEDESEASLLDKIEANAKKADEAMSTKAPSKGLVTKQINELENQKADATDAAIKRLRAEKQQELGVDNLTAGQKKEIRIRAQEDPEVLRISNEINKLKNSIGLKAVDGAFTPSDIENINVFIDWVKNNLPDSITVDDLNNLANNIVRQGRTVGAFVQGLNNIGGKVEVNGVIYVGADSPFKYHEAFHGVFRLLLSEKDIVKYLGIAKKEKRAELKKEGKTLSRALSEMRELHPFYMAMSNTELEERMYEEHLADKFDEWKTNKKTETSPTNKSLFAKIIDFIKKVLGLYSKNELHSLFDSIDSGKFKNTKVANNRFTGENNPSDVSTPVLKAIEMGTQIIEDVAYSTEGEQAYIEVPKILPEQDGTRLTAAIANQYNDVLEKAEPGTNQDDLLEEILDKYEELYDPERDEYVDLSARDYEKVKDYRRIFALEKNRNIIKEAVKDHLSFISKKFVTEVESEEELVDELGDRGKQNYTEGAENIGGFGSLSKYLRSWIATVSYETKDQFGNEYFLDGTRYTEAVDASRVYAGILKAVANTEKVDDVLIKLNTFKDQNPEAGKVITKFFEDTGVTFNENNEPDTSNVVNSYLFQSFIKGFGQYSYKYTFINKDIKSGEIDILDANRKNPGKIQMELWNSAYNDLYASKVENDPSLKKKALNALNDIKAGLQPTKKYTDDQLIEVTNKLSQKLADSLGIVLSPLFLSYSITSSIKTLTPKQEVLFQAYSEIEPLTMEDIDVVYSLIETNEDPFLNTKVEEQIDEETNEVIEVEEFRGGATTRLNNIASSNYIFDESVMPAVWTNAEGKTVYAHQLPSYHGVKLTRLQKEGALDREVAQDPFLEKNPLVRSQRFRNQLRNVSIERIDGQKVSILTKTEKGVIENKQLERNKRDGVTYGRFAPEEFITTLLDLYQKGTEVTENDETYATSSHLIRVLEASSTGNIISNLPLIKAVEKKDTKNKFTKEVLDAIVSLVEQEFDRIRRVQAEIDSSEGLAEEILGYNVPDSKGNMRGLTLHKTGFLLDEGLKESIENAAKEQKELSVTDIAKIKKSAEKVLTQEVDDLYNVLIDNNIITINKDGKISLSAVSNFLTKGFTITEGKKSREDNRKNSLYNIRKDDVLFNLTQIYLNDFINTTAINQLMHGDHAISFKDAVDEIKRAKGSNASGQSAYTEVTDPALGIEHKFDKFHAVTINDPVVYGKFKKGKVEVADAQMWMTTKALRYTLFGLGKLSPMQAKLLDKIEKGEKLTGEEFFGRGNNKGFVSFDAATNSIKLVYFDGKQYIKTSGFVLTKEFTSYGEGFNKALPGSEELHNLRLKLEEYESVEGRNTVGVAIPVSASKGKKVNVASSVDEISDKNFVEFDTNFLRLQQENPSNKVKITDPTQVKQLLMAEQNDDTIVNFAGQDITVRELKEIYQATAIARVKSNYLFKRNEIFTIQDAINEVQKSVDAKKVTPKLEVFQKYAVDRLKESAADAQLIEFFELDETGMPKYDLNNPLTMDKFAELFLAFFSKGVLSEKIPGHSVALVSNFGKKKLKKVLELDENGQPKRWEIVRDEEFLLNPNKYEGYKEMFDRDNRTFNNLEVGDYYVDDLRHNVPEYDDKGNITGYFTEFIMPAHFREVYDNMKPGDKIPDVIAKMFGVRIPSQDKHSAINLKLVDFMPVYYGSSAVFPSELVEISGADFDIDKLYLAIKEFYTQKKKGKTEFIEYGTGKTDNDKFNQFVKYQFSKNKEFREVYFDFIKEAEEEAQELLTLDIDVNDSDYFQPYIEQKKFLEAALKFVNLPSTAAEYVKKVNELGYEPYNGALNNTIVDARIALFGNKDMVTSEGDSAPKAFQVASTSALEDIVNDFKKLFGEQLKDQLDEGKYSTDTLMGKFFAFKNNKEGARNIGPAVNSLLVYTLLNQNKITVKEGLQDENGNILREYRFKFDGTSFGSFANTRAYNSATGKYTGERIMDTLSTLISAMTDNAKERLAAKLNLNIDSLGVVATMVSQGVPLRDSILFINQPVIRRFYKELNSEKSSYSGEGFKAGASGILKGLIEDYTGEEGKPLNTLALEENMKVEDTGVTLSTLLEFEKLRDQTDAFINLSQVMKVNKGLPTNMTDFDAIMNNAEDLGYKLNDKQFNSSGIPIDVRSIINDENQTVGFNFRVYEEISSLSRTIMLQRTPLVNKLREAVLNNLNVNRKDTATFRQTFDKDVISYFAIKAYKELLRAGGMSRALASLNNGIIYDETESMLPENMNDVVDVVQKLRSLAPDNYFVNNFIFAHKAAQKSNRDNINKITANTWAKLNKLQVNKLQYSLTELYSDPETAPYVIDIFHYLLVKDGGKFKSDSFIRMIPNFVFDKILQSSSNAVRTLMSETPSESSVKKIFGSTLDDIYNEFLRGYTIASSNSYYIPKRNNLSKNEVDKLLEIQGLPKITGAELASVSPVKVDQSNKENKKTSITINMFDGVKFESDYVLTGKISEYFDTATNSYITVDEVQDIPGTTRMTEEGRSKFKFNLSYLRRFGLDLSKTGKEKGNKGIGFPLVIKRVTSDPLSGKITSYFKLTKIKQNRKFLEGENIIEAGESYVYGTEAVYEKIDLQGSYKQFAAGFVIDGYQPTTAEIKEKSKTSKSTPNFGNFNLDAVSDVDKTLSQIDNVDFSSDPNVNRNTPTDSTNYKLKLNSEFGINIEVVNNRVEYTKDGKPFDTMGAKSAEELYNKLKPAPTENIPDNINFEEPGPEDVAAIDAIADNVPDSIPAIDMKLLMSRASDFPGLVDFYQSLTEDQKNKVKSQYGIKDIIDLTDQFIAVQSTSAKSETEFIDDLKQCYL